MDNKKIQFVGEPVNQHGSYTFYKSFKYLMKNGQYRTISISEFFFVKIWNDSDLVSIGELQLLWEDKNSDKILSSLRLYFLPENTPDGRAEGHGEDEVMAITEKVVLKVEDLISWIIPGGVEWRWGHQANWISPSPKYGDQNEPDNGIKKEVVATPGCSTSPQDGTAQSVVVLSFPRYCRYRSIARRLEGGAEDWMQTALVAALGGIIGVTINTRVLFCKDTFDYPDLETHELLCNHLAPKLTGRPRKKRKKRSSSPGSESNESEISSFSAGSSSGKCLQVTRGALRQSASPRVPTTPTRAAPGLRRGQLGGVSSGARKASATSSREEQEFLEGLYAFMEKKKSPIDRVPHLGFKQIDMYAFYKKVRGLGGYKAVTTRKLWKRIYDELGGSQSNTSAATCTRKHYERLLLPYEEKLATESAAQKGPRRRIGLTVEKRVVAEKTLVQKKTSVQLPEPTLTIEEVPSTSRRKSTAQSEESPALKKRKLEILQQGGLEVTPIGQSSKPISVAPTVTPTSTPSKRTSVVPAATPPLLSNQVSITVTPDLAHMLGGDTFKQPPQRMHSHHMFARTGRIYGNPKIMEEVNEDKAKPDLEVLDLTIKPMSTKLKNVKSTTIPNLRIPQLTILPQNGHNNHHYSQLQSAHQNNNHKINHNKNKVKVPRANLSSSLEITLVNTPEPPALSTQQQQILQLQQLQQFQQQQQQNGKNLLTNYQQQQSKTSNPYNIPLFPDPTMYYALYNSQFYHQNNSLQQQSGIPGSVSPHDLYKSLLSHHSSLPLLACYNQSYPGLPKDGSTSITPLPRSK